jgi:hypothetical protein
MQLPSNSVPVLMELFTTLDTSFMVSFAMVVINTGLNASDANIPMDVPEKHTGYTLCV